MGKKEENTDFVCSLCHKEVKRIVSGSYRNHCPFCLSSVHLDNCYPGDRKSSCFGIMRAIASRFHSKKGWQIIHKCTECGVEKINKIVENDPQRDDWEKIVALTQPKWE